MILIVGTTLAIRARRESSEDGSMTYGQGLGTGALTGVFTGLFSAVFMILYAQVINPGFIPTLREQQQAVMAQRGMSQAQIDQAAQFMEKFISPIVLTLTAAFSGFVIVVIVALIVAAVFKRAAPEPAFDPPPLQG